MKIVSLQAENFKRLEAVEITPEGNMVTIGGKNGAGKSSVLDAIWVALRGRAAAPPRPIRDGEERCTIRLDLGDIIISRTFTAKEGSEYTDTIKVEDESGRRYPSPQSMLNDLIGEIGFDPFDFVQQKPERQAEILMGLVPLTVDLEELAEADASDYAKRRDINRDIKTLDGQLEGMPKEQLPEDAPDRDALVNQLSTAAETNAAIASERQRREQLRRDADRHFVVRDDHRSRAEELRDRAADLDSRADSENASGTAIEKEIEELKPLDTPVDTATLREQIAAADQIEQIRARQARRQEVVEKVRGLRTESEALTAAMVERERRRDAALAEAQMPIEGLGFAVNEAGKSIVTYRGLPFTEDQISTAAALRVSTAIAMAANPQLRVLRIKDGSLLDDESMAVLAEMVEAEDYQLWVERVGTGGVGIIIENGQVQTASAGKTEKAESKVDDSAQTSDVNASAEEGIDS